MKIKSYLLATAIISSGAVANAAGNMVYNTNEESAVRDGGVGGNGTNVEPINPDAKAASYVFSPVVTSLNGTTLDVLFINMLGTVEMTVTDEAGLVHYRKQLQTAPLSKHTVDISLFPQGVYTVKYTNTATGFVLVQKVEIK